MCILSTSNVTTAAGVQPLSLSWALGVFKRHPDAVCGRVCVPSLRGPNALFSHLWVSSSWCFRLRRFSSPSKTVPPRNDPPCHTYMKDSPYQPTSSTIQKYSSIPQFSRTPGNWFIFGQRKKTFSHWSERSAVHSLLANRQITWRAASTFTAGARLSPEGMTNWKCPPPLTA